MRVRERDGVLESKPTRKDEHDGIRFEAARDEPEDLARGCVEPVRVVDESHDRLLRPKVAQQIQRRQSQEEQLRASARRAEGVHQRSALSVWQPAGLIEYRLHELVEAGKWHRRLGFDAGRTQHQPA